MVSQRNAPPIPLTLEQLLDDVESFLRRFVSYPSEHSLVAHALWIAHSHFMDAWDSTPRIAFLSPEPASGKTRALEITETLVPRAVEAINVTPAYLFRKVGDENDPPTILYDEIDTVFGPKARDNEEIRGLLNAGHRRGAVAGRCVFKGNQIQTEEISAYCAVALAGLGGLPDTILSRSVVIRMQRRKTNESIEPYRRRIHAPEGEHLKDQLATLSDQMSDNLTNKFPEMPPSIKDRDADIWEPLLAMADAAGGEWPYRGREAAVSLVNDSKESSPSLGIRLLSDLREVFEDREKMFTKDILESLNKMEEAPWGNIRGKPLDARGLASLLKPYEVSSAQVRIDEATNKGYKSAGFVDPWSRYIAPPLKPERETCETEETVNVFKK